MRPNMAAHVRFHASISEHNFMGSERMSYTPQNENICTQYTLTTEFYTSMQINVNN